MLYIDRIKQFRQTAGVTQAQMAETLGIIQLKLKIIWIKRLQDTLQLHSIKIFSRVKGEYKI